MATKVCRHSRKLNLKNNNELETLIYGQGFNETDIIKLTLTMLFYSDVNSRIGQHPRLQWLN